MEITGAGGISGPRRIQNKKIEAASPADAPAAAGPGADKVELSDASRFLQGLERIPSVRLDKIRELRMQIEAGQYESPEKLSKAIDKLLEDLTG